MARTERRIQQQEERGAVDDAIKTPVDVVKDVINLDLGDAVEEVVRYPFRIGKKILNFDL